MLTGSLMALLASLCWAVSATIVKSIAGKIDTIVINTIRLWVGAAALLAIVTVSGRLTAIADVPKDSLVFIIASGFLAMAIGDTIYIKAMTLLDASIAFSMAQCAFVLMAGVTAILWLDEPYTWITVVGAAFVMAGIYLMTANRADGTGTQQVTRAGVLVTLSASFIWTTSTITLKFGAAGLDPLVVATIRICISAGAITALSAIRWSRIRATQRYDARTIGLVVTAGLMSYGVAAVSYVVAIQTIGAGRTVLLTASSPLFALPLAILFLRERPSPTAIVGIVTAVIGVYFVII